MYTCCIKRTMNKSWKFSNFRNELINLITERDKLTNKKNIRGTK